MVKLIQKLAATVLTILVIFAFGWFIPLEIIPPSSATRVTTWGNPCGNLNTLQEFLTGFISQPQDSLWASVSGTKIHTAFGKEGIAHFPDSSEISRREIIFNNIPLDMLTFNAHSSMPKISHFYKTVLEKEGWIDLSGTFWEYANLNSQGEDRAGGSSDFHIFRKENEVFVLILERIDNNVTKGIITYCSARKEDLLKSASLDDNKDAPGREPYNFTRYPASQRQLSIEDKGSDSYNNMVMYHSNGTVGGQYQFYKRQMLRRGWKTEPEMENMNLTSNDRFISFYQGNKNCLIFIRENPEKSGTDTLVIYQNSKKGNE